ncbi:hypothetical protein DY000_02041605 [Brassica cretica]|uniref:RING-type domain-containing protein n=1 Tax=Brassica cretica TaxID=69181 RepID=A0ABQ7B8B5_BRACR|nr:hypothetical protein DY000_02041605 [Brassica cretica]
MNNQIIADGFPVIFGDRQLQHMQSRAADPIQTAPSFNKYHFNQSPAILKRQRDYALDSNALMTAQKRRSVAFAPPQSLIEAQLVSQIQQQQTDIDLFVTQQTQTLRLELEARQRTQTSSLASANACLYVENQILRDLAQNNEATANTLRSNLEHVLAQVDEFPATAATGGDVFHPPVEEDTVSSCGSCDGADGGDVTAVTRGCKRCGERTASVLVLPCRHLCLCTVCGSALLQACPVCNTVMHASVHVNNNMS